MEAIKNGIPSLIFQKRVFSKCTLLPSHTAKYKLDNAPACAAKYFQLQNIINYKTLSTTKYLQLHNIFNCKHFQLQNTFNCNIFSTAKYSQLHNIFNYASYPSP
jgi:hypothetical protein